MKQHEVREDLTSQSRTGQLLGWAHGGDESALLDSHVVCTEGYSKRQPSRDATHTANNVLQNSVNMLIFSKGTPRVSQQCDQHMGASSMSAR